MLVEIYHPILLLGSTKIVDLCPLECTKSLGPAGGPLYPEA